MNESMTPEELEKRKEELRIRRETRGTLARRKKRINRGRIFLCVIMLALVVAIIVFCLNFPGMYQKKRAAETPKPSASTAAVSPSPTSTATPTPSPTPSPSAAPKKASGEFSAFPNYHSENEERYAAYQQARPDLSASQVVWQVNSLLDLNEFTQAQQLTADQLNSDLLIVVNKHNRVPDDYEPYDLVSNQDGVLMRAPAQEAFDRMSADMAAQGMVLRAVSGYRSVSYQEGLYNSYLAQDSQAAVDRYSARAGFSEHHTGLAIDVFGSVDGLNEFETTPEYIWVRDNAYRYGFIIRYTTAEEPVTGYENEPWHIRYIGTEHATQMVTEGITTLEEYRDLALSRP